MLTRCINKQDGDHFAFLFFIISAFFIQTIFFEDYIVRKFLILIPSLLGALYLLYLNRDTNLALLPKWMKHRYAKIAWTCFVMLLVTLIAAYRLLLISDGTRLDFSRFDLIAIFAAGVLPSLAACVAWILFDHDKGGLGKFLWRWGIILGISTLTLNIGLNMEYVWTNQTYTERDAMIQIESVVDHKYVFGGGYQLGFTLYNNMLPIVENQMVYCKYVVDTPDSYVLDYAEEDEETRNRIDNEWFFGSDESLILFKTIERNFQTFGRAKDMGLFVVAPKQDIVKTYQEKYEAEKENYYDLIEAFNHTIGLSSEQIKEYQSAISSSRTEMEAANIYPDIYEDIQRDITQNIYVSIHGNIYGDVYAVLYGDIYGNIYGDLHVKPQGEIFGTIYGRKLYKD